MISRIPDRHPSSCAQILVNRAAWVAQHTHGVSRQYILRFPNRVPYFGQIPDPEITLPDPQAGFDCIWYQILVCENELLGIGLDWQKMWWFLARWLHEKRCFFIRICDREERGSMNAVYLDSGVLRATCAIVWPRRIFSNMAEGSESQPNNPLSRKLNKILETRLDNDKVKVFLYPYVFSW